MPGSDEDPLYPEIEPFHSGHLAVGDGHELYYEQCGNKTGKPVLFLHGGPGAGCSPKSRQFFDPATYMIVVFDQRGCNRSKPNAADDIWAALKCNTTQDLVSDCEKLRAACKVEGAWHVVLGGSWGSTLALAYAQTHPTCVKSLVLRGVFTGEQSDIDYLFNDGGMLAHHPEAWVAYTKHLSDTAADPASAAEDARHPLAAYYRRLTSNDSAVASAAAAAFATYELTLIKNQPPHEWIKEYCADPQKLIPFTTFEAHYMLHHVFLRSGELLEGCAKLPKDLKVRICHGRADFCTRPIAAYRLTNSLRANGVEDVVMALVNGAGHHDSENPVAAAMVRATDELRA